MKIAIFGGTFNPPHEGHAAAARVCIETLSLDKLFFVPGNIPPHKQLPDSAATAEQRFEMCSLISSMVDRSEVSRIEIDRQGVSYTVDTLEAFRQMHPDAELYMIVGSDMFFTLSEWKDAQRLLSMVQIAVVARKEGVDKKLAKEAKRLNKAFGTPVHIIPSDPIDISSTQLRDGQGFDLLPQCIIEYIADHELYNPKLEVLRDFARQNSDKKRFEHILGVESTAVRLASIFGVDEYKARAAALLHDVTKKLSFDEQLQVLEKWDIILNYAPEDFPRILHSHTGAAWARHKLGIGREICRAIELHSTGDSDMTDLDKILYISDAAEPSRSEQYAGSIRAVMENDLDKAMIAALYAKISRLKEGNKLVHPDAYAALNQLLKEKENI